MSGLAASVAGMTQTTAVAPSLAPAGPGAAQTRHLLAAVLADRAGIRREADPVDVDGAAILAGYLNRWRRVLDDLAATQ